MSLELEACATIIPARCGGGVRRAGVKMDEDDGGERDGIDISAVFEESVDALSFP